MQNLLTHAAAIAIEFDSNAQLQTASRDGMLPVQELLFYQLTQVRLLHAGFLKPTSLE